MFLLCTCVCKGERGCTHVLRVCLCCARVCVGERGCAHVLRVSFSASIYVAGDMCAFGASCHPTHLLSGTALSFGGISRSSGGVSELIYLDRRADTFFDSKWRVVSIILHTKHARLTSGLRWDVPLGRGTGTSASSPSASRRTG